MQFRNTGFANSYAVNERCLMWSYFRCAPKQVNRGSCYDIFFQVKNKGVLPRQAPDELTTTQLIEDVDFSVTH